MVAWLGTALEERGATAMEASEEERRKRRGVLRFQHRKR
jgi:hypothetical protein